MIMNNTEEIWKDIPGYEGLYQASNLGRVKSLSRRVMHDGFIYNTKERILKIDYNDKSHCARVALCKHGKRQDYVLKYLIAMTFLHRTPLKEYVVNIDGDFKNNTVDNLLYCTPKQCTNYYKKNGSTYKAFKPKKIVQLDPDGNVVRIYSKLKSVKEYGFNTKKVSSCCDGEQKQHKGYRWLYYKQYLKSRTSWKKN